MSATCPECQQVYASEHALKTHYGMRHGHLPWPWEIKKPLNVRKRKAPVRRTAFPKWRE